MPGVIIPTPDGGLVGIHGDDNGTWTRVTVDAAGNLQVDVLSTPLDAALASVATDQIRADIIASLPAGSNLIGQVQERPYKTYTGGWSGNVAGGASQDIIDVTGSGFLLGGAVFIDGNDALAMESRFKVYVDGEASPSIDVRTNAGRHDLTKAFGNKTLQADQSPSSPFGWGNIYDGTIHMFSGGFALKSHFATSLLVTFTNGDSVNATYIDASVFYALWQS